MLLVCSPPAGVKTPQMNIYLVFNFIVKNNVRQQKNTNKLVLWQWQKCCSNKCRMANVEKVKTKKIVKITFLDFCDSKTTKSFGLKKRRHTQRVVSFEKFFFIHANKCLQCLQWESCSRNKFVTCKRQQKQQQQQKNKNMLSKC